MKRFCSTELVAVAFISLIGIYIRFKLGMSMPITGDELGSLLLSLNGAGNAVFNNWDIKYNPPMTSIILSMIFDAGGTVGTARFVFSAIGSAIAPAIFVMSRRYFGAASSLLLCFIVAINPLMISVSFLMRGASIACLFMIISLYFLHDAIKSNTNPYMFLAFAALALYSHYMVLVVFFFVAIHLFRNRVEFPARFGLHAAALFLPALLLIIWGMLSRNSDVQLPSHASPVLMYWRGYVKTLAYGFSGTESALAAVFVVGSLFARHEEALFRNIWIPAVFAGLILSGVFNIYARYLCPMMVIGWTSACSMYSQPSRPTVMRLRAVAATAYLLVLAAGAFNFMKNNAFDANDVRAQLSAIKSAGIQTIMFEDPEDDLPMYYGIYTGSPIMAAKNKQSMLKSFTQMDTQGLDKNIYNKYEIRFIEIIDRNNFNDSIRKAGPNVAIVRNRSNPRRQNDNFLNGCSILLKGSYYISYHCLI